MNLYLIRHAEAENPTILKSDFDRKLTQNGIEKFTQAVIGWKNLIKDFDYIVTSPYLRALQTAEIVSMHYPPGNGKLIQDSKLGCGSITDDIIEIIDSLKADNIALVGHEPDFSELVSALISNSGAFLNFKKGMIAKINFNGKIRKGSGILDFFIPVKTFNSN